MTGLRNTGNGNPTGPRAIGTQADMQAKRNALYVYVRDHVFGPKPLDPAELARLVNEAPAELTLTKGEWWNVALCLAMEVNRGKQ